MKLLIFQLRLQLNNNKNKSNVNKYSKQCTHACRKCNVQKRFSDFDLLKHELLVKRNCWLKENLRG